MKKHLLMSMLFLALGGHFIVSAAFAGNTESNQATEISAKDATYIKELQAKLKASDNPRAVMADIVLQRKLQKGKTQARVIPKSKAIRNRDSSNSSSKASKESCCSARLIKQSDFNDAGELLIDQSGSYKFQKSLFGSIIIAADDVVLDLCNHQLQPKFASNFIGIEIIPGHRNITVTNGTISGFKTDGTHPARAIHAFIPESTPQLTLNTLLFTDLVLTDNGGEIAFPNGIEGTAIFLESELSDFPQRQTRFAFFNVTIQRVKANQSVGNSIIGVTFAQNLRFEDTQANDLTLAIDGDPGAAFVLRSENVTIFNCQFNNVTHTDPFAIFGLCGGLAIFSSNNILLKDTQSNNIFGSQFIVTGAFFSGCQDALIENCQFNQVTGGDGLEGFGVGSTIISGIHISDSPNQEFSTKGLKFINCQFNDITRLGTTKTLFNPLAFVEGSDIITFQDAVFESCQAIRIKTENPFYSARGWLISSFPQDPVPPFGDIANILFKDCFVSQIAATNDVFGIAFHVEPSEGKSSILKNIVVEDCVVQRVFSSSSVGKVGGIAEYSLVGPSPLLHLKNFLVKNCRVCDVHGGGSALSAGILVESVQNPVISNNSVSDCENGILFTGQEEVPGFVEKGLVQENNVSNCTVSGYRDNRCPTNSAWLNNVAFNNGTPATHKTNYLIHWGGRPPVCKGDLAKYPKCEGIQNVSLLESSKKKHCK